ncbi:16S rRNA (cytidine(1402)-2'-O)-methyltransferase [Sessilibacter sp. MAH4]
MTSNTNWGQLYIVATPIGNLADMAPRALDVLSRVDLIAAEDTRHSIKLLEHFQISTTMTAYHDFSDNNSTEKLIDKLKSGLNIALISDAGTPLISDPGYRLVQRARQEGLSVTPIPGACALIAALSASGLATDRFHFEGFLPAKTVARSKILSDLSKVTATLVFYEAPHRILSSLQDMATVFGGERQVVVARELSKTFETFLSGSLDEVITTVSSDSNQQRGEIVVMVSGAVFDATEIDPDAQKLLLLLIQSLPLKQAASIVSEYSGIKKNKLYDWGLSQKD